VLTVPREMERDGKTAGCGRVSHLHFAPCRLSVDCFTARGYLAYTITGCIIWRRQRGSASDVVKPTGLRDRRFRGKLLLFAGGQLTATINALKSALLHGLQRPREPCCLLLVELVEVIVRSMPN